MLAIDPTAKVLSRRAAKGLLRQAKAEAAASYPGLNIYAENMGDGFIRMYKTDKVLQNWVSITATYGVTVEDHRRWNNTPLVVRCAMLLQDEWIMVASFKGQVENGILEADAAKQIRKTNAIYTNNADELVESDPDAPLPEELKLRVNDFRDSMIVNNPEEFERTLMVASSSNSWVRDNVVAGAL